MEGASDGPPSDFSSPSLDMNAAMRRTFLDGGAEMSGDQGDDGWTPRAAPNAGLLPEDVRALRGRLRERELMLRQRFDAAQEQVLEARRGRPTDAGDAVRSSQQRNRAHAMRLHLRRELAEVEAALERMKRGTYGVDETTGEPIGPRRLAARPEARVRFVARVRIASG
jgi:DnaK suppressor protein